MVGKRKSVCRSYIIFKKLQWESCFCLVFNNLSKRGPGGRQNFLICKKMLCIRKKLELEKRCSSKWHQNIKTAKNYIHGVRTSFHFSSSFVLFVILFRHSSLVWSLIKCYDIIYYNKSTPYFKFFLIKLRNWRHFYVCKKRFGF